METADLRRGSSNRGALGGAPRRLDWSVVAGNDAVTTVESITDFGRRAVSSPASRRHHPLLSPFLARSGWVSSSPFGA